MTIVDPSIELASRILGVLVFAVAAIGKLRHGDEFRGVVANYRLLPAILSTPAAWTIVLLEIFVVIALVSGVAVAVGALLAVLLLVGFTLGMAINLGRGRTQIDCGCFQSALRQRLSGALIVRNLLLIAVLVPGALGAIVSRSSIWGALVRAPTTTATIDGVAAGAVLFLLYQSSGLLITLRDMARALDKRFV